MERERGKEQEGILFLLLKHTEEKASSSAFWFPPAFNTRKDNFFELQEGQGWLAWRTD